MFAGSKHPKYTTYLLELHCLLKYESSDALQTAILNNYLIKFGIAAQERDLMIEHHVFKLEDMVSRAGGEFGSPFYRDLIGPNIDNMTRVNTTLMTAFDLQNSKHKHTKAKMAPEHKILSTFFKETQLHLFRSTRTYDHIALDILSGGYTKVGTGGKLATFITETSKKAKFLEAIDNAKEQNTNTAQDEQPRPLPLSPQSSNSTSNTSNDVPPAPDDSESDSSKSTSTSRHDSSSDEEVIIPTLASQFGFKEGSSDEEDEDEQEDEEMRGERSNEEENWSD